MRVLQLLVVLITAFLLSSCYEGSDRWQHDMAVAMNDYGSYSKERLEPALKRAHLHYPPKQIALLAFKKSKQLQLWARDRGAWNYVKSYPILGASGHLGPKLKRGDLQVPEGVYKIKSFNPSSHFTLSMEINYPNAFDKAHAKADHRRHLGREIFIHGTDRSIGCVAIGDAAIEELFILAKLVGKHHIKVVIAPTHFHKNILAKLKGEPTWTSELYEKIKLALMPFDKSLAERHQLAMKKQTAKAVSVQKPISHKSKVTSSSKPSLRELVHRLWS